MPRSVHERAPAKLNLFLEVLGRRPDGYHEIVTVMHEIDLADDVEVALAPGPGPRVDLAVEGDPLVPAGAENTAHAAARLFLERFAPGAAVSIRLEKRVPAGAGLGGGSSDAAAVLRALPRLLGVAPDAEELGAVAARVGSDVPFFLAGGGTAIARGRGERIERIDSRPDIEFVLATPPFPSPTAAVYSALSFPLTPPARVPTILVDWLRRRQGRGDRGKVFFNRLEEPAFRIVPGLREFRDRIAAASGSEAVRMTGSGSTFFLALASEESAEEASDRIARGVPSARISIARSAGAS